MNTTLEGWVAPEFPTMLTDISIRDRINLKLETTRGYENVYPVSVAAAQHPVDHIEEINQRFTLNKVRHLQLTRELQLCLEDLAEDADLTAQWGRARSSNAPAAPSSSRSPQYASDDEINLTQQCPQSQQQKIPSQKQATTAKRPPIFNPISTTYPTGHEFGKASASSPSSHRQNIIRLSGAMSRGTTTSPMPPVTRESHCR